MKLLCSEQCIEAHRIFHRYLCYMAVLLMVKRLRYSIKPVFVCSKKFPVVSDIIYSFDPKLHKSSILLKHSCDIIFII